MCRLGCSARSQRRLGSPLYGITIQGLDKSGHKSTALPVQTLYTDHASGIIHCVLILIRT